MSGAGRSSRRETQSPGTIGAQKLKPRNNSVAASAAGRVTPTIRSRSTEAASYVPNPPGEMLTVRNTFAIMKVANTALAGAVAPTARISTHIVAASSRKTAHCQALVISSRRGCRESRVSAPSMKLAMPDSHGTRRSHGEPAHVRPAKPSANPASDIAKTMKSSETVRTGALVLPSVAMIPRAAISITTYDEW